MEHSNDAIPIHIVTLKEILLRRMPEPGSYATPVRGLFLHRRDISNMPENCITKPIISVATQATKRTVLGVEEYRYSAGSGLIAGVDMPSMSYMTDATPENPYLGVSIELDYQVIALLATQIPASATCAVTQGVAVVPIDPEVFEACLRLVELLDKPEEIPFLAPLILKEIFLLLLLGPQGGLLKAMITQGAHSNLVFRGINLLREHFMKPLDVDMLAEQVNMAPSTFRKHFKTVTGMSPTQYHKHLRLYEAQRMMLEDNKDATTSGYDVGYESLNQFNREYRRLFGDPPKRNVDNLR